MKLALWLRANPEKARTAHARAPAATHYGFTSLLHHQLQTSKKQRDAKS